jgi:hypothetical protein
MHRNFKTACVIAYPGKKAQKLFWSTRNIFVHFIYVDNNFIIAKDTADVNFLTLLPNNQNYSLAIEAETCCHLVTLNKINIRNTSCVLTCESLLFTCVCRCLLLPNCFLWCNGSVKVRPIEATVKLWKWWNCFWVLQNCSVIWVLDKILNVIKSVSKRI